MVKIRLSLKGAKKKPFYKIVAADSRSPRDGKFIEQLGFFDPRNIDPKKKIYININRIKYWIKNGAVLSNRINNIIKNINKFYK
ncbi:30S ribosomal protein S16 [Buchnera aphidicola]|uniref:30S ribosomal protein S16 n=1 Tax=Buchnera aphidicola TaxID=9 RepID=UPI0034642E74